MPKDVRNPFCTSLGLCSLKKNQKVKICHLVVERIDFAAMCHKTYQED